MPMIGPPSTVVTATLLVMRKQYHGEALIFAAPTGPVASLRQTSMETRLALILFWIRQSLLRHLTHFQTPRLIRSTFRVRTVAITVVLTIRTFGHTISRRSRLRFQARIVKASMVRSPAIFVTNI